MHRAIRPRRSHLYMPGSNQRALQKAAELPADGLILDLEDSVAPNAKNLARQQVVDAISTGGYGNRELVVRINGLDTRWGLDDIKAVASCGADACLLPKIESPTQLANAERLLDAAGANRDLPLWIMAETPRGVLDLDRIAGSSPRLEVIVVGTSDLAKGLRADPGDDRAGLLTALSHCVLAARAQGLDILDGVHLDLDDAAGFTRDCEQGRRLGFDGKTLIHPKQIAAANEIFGVSDSEASRAQAILAAWEEAAQNDQAVVVVKGRLVEELHVDEARRVLALHAATTNMQGEKGA